jgi:hypothetical protein
VRDERLHRDTRGAVRVRDADGGGGALAQLARFRRAEVPAAGGVERA